MNYHVRPMNKQRSCPACGKILENGEMHLAKPFDNLNQVPQMPLKRFWICNATINSLEKLIKMYQEAKIWDGFVNVP